MIQDSFIIEKRHHRFIKTVCISEIVYGLKNTKGFASSSSVHFESDNGEPVGLICFWAEKALAKSCIKGGWIKYQVIEIPLSDFIENWCVGTGNDGLLIGTEFDRNLFGFEAEPLELILDLISELKSTNKTLTFRKFKGLEGLEKQIKQVLQ